MRGMNLPPHKEVCCPTYITEDEWGTLNEAQRQFLHEAEEGGMRYLVLEDGRVCAWGVAIAGIFSMEVKAERNQLDGWVVTLP